MTPASHIRSPTTGYPTSYNSSQQQLHAAGYGYPQAPDPRNLPPSVPSMTYDATGAPIPRRTSMSVDRTSRLSVHAPSPYARQPPQMSSTYNPEPEPMIKKKRKRADAEQLKVLNDTYARTAFPSTEERIELAKKLGMSARSVQIWYASFPHLSSSPDADDGHYLNFFWDFPLYTGSKTRGNQCGRVHAKLPRTPLPLRPSHSPHLPNHHMVLLREEARTIQPHPRLWVPPIWVVRVMDLSVQENPTPPLDVPGLRPLLPDIVAEAMIAIHADLPVVRIRWAYRYLSDTNYPRIASCPLCYMSS